MKQNEQIMKLIGDISVNVADIDRRLATLERKYTDVNKMAKKNGENMAEVKSKVQNLQRSVGVLTINQTKYEQYDERLKLVEAKLTNHVPHVQDMDSNRGDKTKTDDTTLVIKNLPYSQKDEDDVNMMFRNGLGIQVRIKSVRREPSVYNNAGVVAIELGSQQDKEVVLRNKRKLRYKEQYADVYIESSHTSVQKRLEEKMKMLIDVMQNKENDQPRFRRHRYNHADRRQYQRWNQNIQ